MHLRYELLRRNGLPLLADELQQELRLVALGDSEEDVVKGIKAHSSARQNCNAFRHEKAMRAITSFDILSFDLNGCKR